MYTNIIINKVHKGYYHVIADSTRFGPSQIVFEGSTKKQCNEFIKRSNEQKTYSPDMSTYYVTMTDTFLSGWGHATNKTAKYVIECHNFNEAYIVSNNAKDRTDMKHVRITRNKPYYNRNTHQTTYRTKEDVPTWFQQDAFKKEENN